MSLVKLTEKSIDSIIRPEKQPETGSWIFRLDIRWYKNPYYMSVSAEFHTEKITNWNHIKILLPS